MLRIIAGRGRGVKMRIHGIYKEEAGYSLSVTLRCQLSRRASLSVRVEYSHKIKADADNLLSSLDLKASHFGRGLAKMLRIIAVRGLILITE